MSLPIGRNRFVICDDVTAAAAIRLAVRHSRLTHEQIAQRVGICVSNLRKHLAHHRSKQFRPVNVRTLLRIVQACGANLVIEDLNSELPIVPSE
jgi:hypothetical protein